MSMGMGMDEKRAAGNDATKDGGSNSQRRGRGGTWVRREAFFELFTRLFTRRRIRVTAALVFVIMVGITLHYYGWAPRLSKGIGLPANSLFSSKRDTAGRGEAAAGKAVAGKAYTIGTKGLPVILIDPGHGGVDGGAVSPDGHIEKEINLSISKCLAEEISPYNVEVIMTRYDENGLYVDDGRTIREKKREDLKKRKQMMEASDVALAISVHLNSFEGNEKIYGIQVFYPKGQRGGTSVQGGKSFSQIVGESVEKSMRANIPDWKIRQTAPKNDTLILKDTTAKLILVECGFMSNRRDMERLNTAEYQRILSKAIWEGANEILCFEKKEKIQVIDSANKD